MECRVGFYFLPLCVPLPFGLMRLLKDAPSTLNQILLIFIPWPFGEIPLNFLLYQPSPVSPHYETFAHPPPTSLIHTVSHTPPASLGCRAHSVYCM